MDGFFKNQKILEELSRIERYLEEGDFLPAYKDFARIMKKNPALLTNSRIESLGKEIFFNALGVLQDRLAESLSNYWRFRKGKFLKNARRTLGGIDNLMGDFEGSYSEDHSDLAHVENLRHEIYGISMERGNQYHD